MRALQGFRYFLGIRPSPALYPSLLHLAARFGQRARLDLLHLTFCVVAERAERDRFIARRAENAIGRKPLHSFPVNLSRVTAGPGGVQARTSGRQAEIQDFYSTLARLLRACGIEPLHRKSGLHPHVTLGYAACPTALLRIALEWFPAELLLIESEVGLGKHNVLRRWPLLPPRQSPLPFPDARFEPLFGEEVIAAASPARRSAA